MRIKLLIIKQFNFAMNISMKEVYEVTQILREMEEYEQRENLYPDVKFEKETDKKDIVLNLIKYFCALILRNKNIKQNLIKILNILFLTDEQLILLGYKDDIFRTSMQNFSLSYLDIVSIFWDIYLNKIELESLLETINLFLLDNPLLENKISFLSSNITILIKKTIEKEIEKEKQKELIEKDIHLQKLQFFIQFLLAIKK